MKQFKHLKTFESFSGEQVNEEFIGKLIDKVKNKFNTWKDSKKKEAATKIAEHLSKNPKELEKLKAEFSKLSEEDKAKFKKVESVKESDIDEMAAKVDQVTEGIGDFLKKKVVNTICRWLGISSSGIGVVTLIIGMVLSAIGGTTAAPVLIAGFIAAVAGGFLWSAADWSK